MVENDILRQKYGVTLQGKPNYRIVYAEKQTEKRFGVFNEFYGKIFLREVRGLREVPKYPYIPKGVYVLEKFYPPERVYDRLIPETAEGAYEPIWSFQDKDGKPLPPKIEACERIIWALEHPQLPGDRASDEREKERKEEEKEIKAFEEEIDVSPMISSLHGKEAVGYTKELKNV